MELNPPFVTGKPPRGRKRRQVASSPPPPPPGPPVLVSATYSTAGGAKVTLGFDRAMQIVGYDGAQLYVYDGPAETAYDGGAAPVLLNATTLRVTLSLGGPASGPDVSMDATELTGIRSVDGDDPWAGVMGLVLPFG